MRPLRNKLAVGAISTAVAALVAWIILQRVERVEPDEVHRAHFADAPSKPPSDPELAPGKHPFDVREPIFPRSTFRRWPLTPEEVRGLLVARNEFVEYDPFDYFHYLPHLDKEVAMEEHPLGSWRLRTNALGFRKDVELRAEQPTLRILVTGDSHTDGVCNNAESFTNLLEAALSAAHPNQSIEALNAGKGSYSFFNYLGVLERLLPLRPDVFVVAVFGGNDFVEALALHHTFEHGAPPSNSAEYEARVADAQSVCGACFAQQYFETAYFQEHPGEIEIALQTARDVTTEIAVTCWRQGIHPLFVYIPPPFEHEADRSAHAETLARVRDALAITPESDFVAQRLADSWIAFLRDRKLDFVDLRPIFRTHTEQLYWARDHHSNLDAQRVIAAALRPVVENIRPIDAERVRLATQTGGEPVTFSSPGVPEPDSVLLQLREFPNALSQPNFELEHRPHYEPLQLDASRASRWFPRDELHEFAPHSWLRNKPNLDLDVHDTRLRTNSLGMRADFEPTSERPDLRIVFAGDENIVGACTADQTAPNELANRLRARHPGLRIECLNAACAGHGLHNFLGVLDECAALAPNLFVVCINGGNDFEAALRIEQSARRDDDAVEPELGARLAQVQALDPAAVEQFARSLQRFRDPAADVRDAVQIAADITDEIQRRCATLGAELIVLYVPPAIDVDSEHVAATAKAHVEVLTLSEADLRGTRRIAHNYLAHLRQDSIQVLDISSTFDDVAGAEYGPDYLLAAPAQRLIAERLALLIEHRDPRLRD